MIDKPRSPPCSIPTDVYSKILEHYIDHGELSKEELAEAYHDRSIDKKAYEALVERMRDRLLKLN